MTGHYEYTSHLLANGSISHRNCCYVTITVSHLLTMHHRIILWQHAIYIYIYHIIGFYLTSWFLHAYHSLALLIQQHEGKSQAQTVPS